MSQQQNEVPLTAATTATPTSESSSSPWMDTKKKRKNERPPPLPLDWTRVKRRRPGSSKSNSDDDNDDDCCPPTNSAIVMDEDSLQLNDEQLVRGLAVICLHTFDPQWFQGYFFPDMTMPSNGSIDDDDNDNNNNNKPWKFSSLQKPWGLLAVQQELDDCMRCADGGYRRVSMTVFNYPGKQTETIKGDIEWTGGDMMRLLGDKLSLEPHQLLTGKRAVPHMETLFGDIVQKCRTKVPEGEPTAVLDLFPDVAIITGPMKLVLSKKKNGDNYV